MYRIGALGSAFLPLDSRAFLLLAGPLLLEDLTCCHVYTGMILAERLDALLML